GNQVIESVRGKNVGVENKDPRGAQALPGDAIIFPSGTPSSGGQRQTDQRSDRDPHSRRNEIIFERIFYEKDDAEEQDEATDPGEKFYAHECFPIDCPSDGRRWWWRRCR